jgi:hypothetical protein
MPSNFPTFPATNVHPAAHASAPSSDKPDACHRHKYQAKDAGKATARNVAAI